MFYFTFYDVIKIIYVLFYLYLCFHKKSRLGGGALMCNHIAIR